MKRKLKKARRGMVGALGWTSLALATGVDLPSAIGTFLVMALLVGIWGFCMWLCGMFEGYAECE